jgi:hypothetical protein
MAKMKSHSRRREDRTWSITPSWMDKVMTICKYFLYVMPFICISIAMLLEPSTTSQSYVITAVWCLSLLKLVEVLDK